MFHAEDQNHLRLENKKKAIKADKDTLDQVNPGDLLDFSAGKLKRLCVKADETQGVGASYDAGKIAKLSGLGTNGCWVSDHNRLSFRITAGRWEIKAALKDVIETSPLFKNEYIQFSNETAKTIDVLVLGIDSTFFYEGNNHCLVKEEIWVNSDKVELLKTTFTSHATIVNWVMAFSMYNNRINPQECEAMCAEVWFIPPTDTSPTKSYVMQVDPDFRYLESGKAPDYYGSQFQAVTDDEPLSFAHQAPDGQADTYAKYLSGVSHQFTVASGESKRFGTMGFLYGIENCPCENFDEAEDTLSCRLTYRVTGHSVDTVTDPPTTGHLSESSYTVPCDRWPITNKVTIS